ASGTDDRDRSGPLRRVERNIVRGRSTAPQERTHHPLVSSSTPQAYASPATIARAPTISALPRPRYHSNASSLPGVFHECPAALLSPPPFTVMAGLVPAIHVVPCALRVRGWPGQARP